MILVNIKSDISGWNRITFQGCTFHWSSSFLMTELKQSWQFWHSYCHGMTKSVKVHRKDQSVNKNAILASFLCFFNFPDRNLIILYKIT